MMEPQEGGGKKRDLMTGLDSRSGLNSQENVTLSIIRCAAASRIRLRRSLECGDHLLHCNT
jgi:hypothetical protein